MNLTIAKEQLISGLQAVQNIVGSRTTLPILSNVLVKAEGSRLELTATDLDVSVSCSVEASVKKAGSTTIPVKKFFGIVRELSSQELELATDDKQVTSLSAGASFYKIRGLASEEFPPISQSKDDRKVVLPQEKIRSMMKKTSFAISTDESRYVLNGIYVSMKENKLTMVATDGRRLALVDEEVDIPDSAGGEYIIPAKAINELNRLLTDAGQIELRFGENQASMKLKPEKGPEVRITTKLIEGNYPNYRQVIPSETKERVTLSREELLHALKRAEIMTSDKANSVKLAFTKNNLAITANSPDVGEARESIAINYKGSDVTVAFNPGYLIEPLNALADEEIFFELIDDLSPGVLKINGPFLYVVMPMRLS
ncbi:DNA polymerase III subunit beta [bacterium]|nr:DNA polymerase III subunit beta [bacterium]